MPNKTSPEQNGSWCWPQHLSQNKNQITKRWYSVQDSECRKDEACWTRCLASNKWVRGKFLENEVHYIIPWYQSCLTGDQCTAPQALGHQKLKRNWTTVKTSEPESTNWKQLINITKIQGKFLIYSAGGGKAKCSFALERNGSQTIFANIWEVREGWMKEKDHGSDGKQICLAEASFSSWGALGIWELLDNWWTPSFS